MSTLASVCQVTLENFVKLVGDVICKISLRLNCFIEEMYFLQRLMNARLFRAKTEGLAQIY